MTPAEEKAEHLVFYYKNLLSPIVLDEMGDFFISRCVKCAIILVDEILSNGGNFAGMSFDGPEMDIDKAYWQQVKEELNKKL